MNELRDALRRTADSAPLQSADLGVIRARATSIRRRRASVAVGGSVAAIAVIAGLGVALAPGGTDHAVPPISSASAVPTTPATPSADPSETPNGLLPERPQTGPVYHVTTTNPTADGTSGGELFVPYWADGELNAPNGSQTPLKDRPDAVTLDPQGDWRVITGGDATQLVHLSADGKAESAPVDSMPGGMAAAPGREATISRSEQGWVLTTNGRVFPLPNVNDTARVDGFAKNGDVYFTLGDGVERLAHVADGSIQSLGTFDRVVTGPQGQDAVPMGDGRWLVENPDGGDEFTLDWAGVGGFSPSGRYVALVGDPDGLVPGSEEVDADGATGTLWLRTIKNGPVSVFTAPPGGFFGPWTWSGDTIVALVFERDSPTSATGTWSIARLSAGGYQLVRSVHLRGRADAPPYVFGAAVTPAP